MIVAVDPDLEQKPSSPRRPVRDHFLEPRASEARTSSASLRTSSGSEPELIV